MFEKHKEKIITWAIYDCDLEVIEEGLVDGKIDPNTILSEGPYKGKSLMEIAVMEGENVVVKLLLKHGGNPNGKTQDRSRYIDVADDEIKSLLQNHKP